MDNTTSSVTDFAPIAKSLNIPEEGVRATVDLLDEGNTVPFITRYRKDRTGGLDEEQIRQIHDSVTRQRQLTERKQKILKSIQSQEKLTDDLKNQILAANTNKVLEDLYLPFKPRKQSLANVARQRGLEPVALAVLTANPEANDLPDYLKQFVSEEKELPTVRDVESGVQHLLAEYFGEQVELRDLARRAMWAGRLNSKKIELRDEDKTPENDVDHAPATNATTSTPTEVKPEASESSSPTTETPDAGVAPTEVSSEPDKPANDEASETSEVKTVEPEPTSETDKAADSTPETAESTVAETTDTETDRTTAAKKPEADPETATTESAPEQESPETEEQTPADPAAEITMIQTVTTAVTSGKDTVTSAADGAKSKKAGKTVAQSKAELAKQRREMRREARHRKRQKLEQSFKDYFDFGEQLKKLPHHRTLALNRGDRSKVLRVRIEFDANKLRADAESKLVNDSHPHATLLRQCLGDALTRSVMPSIDREIRRDLTEKAEQHAVAVFAQNLRKLLLQAPLSGRRVLAIDPGFKSGCKLVALDEFGNVLDHCLVHVIGSAARVEESRARVAQEVKRHNIGVIAIGNGTASRETEQMVAQTISERLSDHEVGYVVVNEAGASVYSTSPIGREELPKFDATVRGAVSIGRRTLDPLSELVKIDPANIGVGLYQHDVKAKHLQESLDAVVESCVNYVGVDVNSASPALLGYVSGLNQLTARRVYEHRLKNGPFKNREDLKSVPGVGDATYVQAAGFLKISDGGNPLDRTWIHPESYEVAKKVLEAIGCELNELAVPCSLEQDAPKSPTANSDSANVAENANKPAQEAAPTEGQATTAEPTPTVESTPTLESSPPESSAAAVETPSPVSEDDPKPIEIGEQTTNAESECSTDAKAPTGTTPPVSPDEKATETVTSDSTEEPPTPPSDPVVPKVSNRLVERLKTANVAELSEQLGVGTLLLKDILSSLARPGRDPREDLAAPLFRRGVMKLEDLTPGMELTGTVLNVVDFGAFVDIGLPDSGLVHVSRLSGKFVNDPHEVVSVGDIVTVWVVDVDMKRRRVSLTAIKPGTETERQPRKPRQQDGANTGGGRGKPKAQGGSKRRDQRGGKGKRAQSNWKPKAKPKPVVPITKNMAEGKEPMRTFSDLLQFHERKKSDGGDKK
ncbi:Tex-like N-terminal domain-containing protein [Planctomycetota bacterium]